MKAEFTYKKIIISLILTFVVLNLTAESFRTGKLSVINVRQETDFEDSVKAGTNEAIALILPEEKKFIEGIELKFEIPESIACWQDSIACSIFDEVSPYPSAKQIDYSGSKKFYATLPGRLSWVVQIPFSQSDSLKTNQYTTIVEQIPDIKNGYIFLRFQPVMKGIPEETMNSKIKVTVKPALADKGELKLSFNGDYQTVPCAIFIDEQQISLDENNKIILDTGVHNISIVSSEYRNENRTVRIDQAKTTDLNIELKSIEPTVLVTAPEGTSIFIDEKQFTTMGKEINIEEGEHKIRFVIGDYEIIRTLSAIKGKTYNVDCTVDLQIQEK